MTHFISISKNILDGNSRKTTQECFRKSPNKGFRMMYEAPWLAICLDGKAIVEVDVRLYKGNSIVQGNKNAKLITIISSSPTPP